MPGWKRVPQSVSTDIRPSCSSFSYFRLAFFRHLHSANGAYKVTPSCQNYQGSRASFSGDCECSCRNPHELAPSPVHPYPQDRPSSPSNRPERKMGAAFHLHPSLWSLPRPLRVPRSPQHTYLPPSTISSFSPSPPLHLLTTPSFRSELPQPNATSNLAHLSPSFHIDTDLILLLKWY